MVYVIPPTPSGYGGRSETCAGSLRARFRLSIASVSTNPSKLADLFSPPTAAVADAKEIGSLLDLSSLLKFCGACIDTKPVRGTRHSTT